MSFFTKRELRRDQTSALIKAIKIHLDTDKVEPADSAHEGEQCFSIDGSKVASVFNSIDEAKAFYKRAYSEYVVSNPAAAISFFDEYLGKNEWMDYVSRQRLIKALTNSIRKIHGEDLEPDIEERIKSKPIEVLKSLFNLNKKSDKDEFYAFILRNRDDDLVTDAVTAMLGDASVTTDRMYVPALDEHKTLIIFGK